MRWVSTSSLTEGLSETLPSPRRLFLLLFIPPLVRAQAASQSAMFGTVQSPNFPEPYPREAQRRWDIRVPAGFRVQLSFSHFDLEPSYLCEYDSVQVRGGAAPVSHEGPASRFKFYRGRARARSSPSGSI